VPEARGVADACGVAVTDGVAVADGAARVAVAATGAGEAGSHFAEPSSGTGGAQAASDNTARAEGTTFETRIRAYSNFGAGAHYRRSPTADRGREKWGGRGGR
jgi:hypothetical protein